MEVPAGNTLGVKLSTSEEKMLSLMALGGSATSVAMSATEVVAPIEEDTKNIILLL